MPSTTGVNEPGASPLARSAASSCACVSSNTCHGTCCSFRTLLVGIWSASRRHLVVALAMAGGIMRSADHESDFDYKGHTRRASKDEPQYEIESDKTDQVAAHKESALTKLKS